jgi:hypothetical protein
LLSLLRAGVEETLGADLVGLYLHGSLASGDFDPQRSDIDFVAVTLWELSSDQVAALAAMHARLRASGLPGVTQLEGSYIPQQAIRRYDAAHCMHPALGADGSFGLDRHGPDWVIQRKILREHGAVLVGPPPATLIEPVSADDLRQGVRGSLREWWAPQLDNPFRLRSSEYQAYAVLTMCRALYTLQTGALATKPQAARWAQATLHRQWSDLIEGALAWRPGVEWDRLDEVLALIQFAVEASQ